jgi:2-oxoglutarate ferredoxin oxidoreductase subunit beta
MTEYPILNAVHNGLKKSSVKRDTVCIASDVFYAPEAVEPLGVDFINTHRGRSIAFGTGMKLGNPDLKVICFVGDLATLGGNHLVHAGRRNMELLVICINNFVYPIETGKESSEYAFSAYSNFERPFTIPHIAKSCGAIFVARWTALHSEELSASIAKALGKQGFSVIEVVSPGGNYFAGIDSLENERELVQYWYEHSVVKHGEDTMNVAIESGKDLIVGEFIERERPTFLDSYNARLSEILGEKFVPYGGKSDGD